MKVEQGQDSVDRCDAEIGSNEPSLPIFCGAANGHYRKHHVKSLL